MSEIKMREDSLFERISALIEEARNLKAMGLPPESIAQATGLSIEEIEAL